MLLQSCQDPVHQSSVLEQVVREYEDVIQVDRDMPLIDQVPQDVIHYDLEGGVTNSSLKHPSHHFSAHSFLLGTSPALT